MEKRTPHYTLSRIKELVRRGAYRVTRTALLCAARDFGYVETSQLAECVLALESRSFYKSMTTHHDSTLWQDVYRPTVKGTPAYVKIQIVSAQEPARRDDTMVVISFKRLEEV